MFGHKHDSHRDDEDIEIIDLDTLNTFDTSDEQSERVWSGEHEKSWREDTRREQPQEHIKRSPLAPRFSARQRYTQLTVTTSLVVLLLGMLVLSSVPGRSKVVSILFPPTPKPVGSNYFYVQGSPSWGHLYIDGKLVVHPPEPTSGKSMPLSLSRGNHTIRWIAPPFVSQQCTFSEPPDPKHDTCLYNQNTVSSSPTGAWLFVFPANLTRLTSPLSQQLISTIQSVLDSSAQSSIVLPGEPYAVDMISQYQLVAQVPLKATLHYQLDTLRGGGGLCSNALELNIPCVYAGQECYTICTAQFFSDAPNVWDALVVVYATWTYTTMSGQLVGQGEPEIAGDVPLYEHLFPLRITWDGVRWHVMLSFSMLPLDMQQFFDPACNSAMNHERLDASQKYVAAYHLGTIWRYVSGSNSADGCLGMVTLNEGPNAPPDASLPVAYCLHRFGVFIAANALAHKYWPNLPVADTYEQHLAQQLAALYKPRQ